MSKQDLKKTTALWASKNRVLLAQMLASGSLLFFLSSADAQSIYSSSAQGWGSTNAAGTQNSAVVNGQVNATDTSGNKVTIQSTGITLNQGVAPNNQLSLSSEALAVTDGTRTTTINATSITTGTVYATNYNVSNVNTTSVAATGNGSFGGNLAVTGNETVGGTLGVTGPTTLSGGATISNGLTVNGGATIDTLTVKTLDVTGTLAYAGSTTFNGNVQTNGNLGVTGTTQTGSLNVTSNAAVGGSLNVGGSTQLNGNFAISGPSTGSPSASVDFGGNRLQDVGTPIAPTDAANKAYVDQGLAAANRRIDKVSEGVAIATSLATPDRTGNQTWAVAANWGDYAGYNAFSTSAIAGIARDVFQPGDMISLGGGIGFGSNSGQVSGRLTVQIAGGGYVPLR
jgi:trimeric autotransporter adhesin